MFPSNRPQLSPFFFHIPIGFPCLSQIASRLGYFHRDNCLRFIFAAETVIAFRIYFAIVAKVTLVFNILHAILPLVIFNTFLEHLNDDSKR